MEKARFIHEWAMEKDLLKVRFAQRESWEDLLKRYRSYITDCESKYRWTRNLRGIDYEQAVKQKTEKKEADERSRERAQADVQAICEALTQYMKARWPWNYPMNDGIPEETMFKWGQWRQGFHRL